MSKSKTILVIDNEGHPRAVNYNIPNKELKKAIKAFSNK